jgi:hypothetical protein
MGIRDKEKSRHDIKSNVGAIVGVTSEPETANENLTQKAYYITKEQYRKLKILSANRDIDMSCLIREMLDKYLDDSIK